jgi:hypothetical protein
MHTVFRIFSKRQSIHSSVCFVDISGIVDHHCLEVVVCFVDIGRIVDHHCLEVVVCFVDIGRIVDL